MKEIQLATRRRWNWKVFLVLVGLIFPAMFLILPFDISRQNAAPGTDLIASIGWDGLLIDRLINLLLIVLPGGIGLALANHIGLGMPFVEGWAKREPVRYPFRHILAIAWIAAVLLVLSSFLLHTLIIDPLVDAMLADLGIAGPEDAPGSPLYGFLAAVSAGINEETLFRLFGLSLLAWLGGLLFHEPDGRPRRAVFWAANILFALGFGAAHLPTAANLGLPINALTVISTLVVNGIGGLVFGWLFWTFGLESAMLAHCLADVIKYSLVPMITMQSVESARYTTTALVAAAIVLALIWAFRSLTGASPARDRQSI
jgi:hypothetical protein